MELPRRTKKWLLCSENQKPVIVAVNKVDKIGELPADFYEFYNLGFGELMAISSIHGLGMGDLLDEIFKYFPEEDAEDYDEDVIKVAVVGKPNVGNRLSSTGF